MKIIEKLSCLIDEEIDGACGYAKLALKYKDERPQLAQTFYSLTVDEMKHIDILHDERSHKRLAYLPEPLLRSIYAR